MNNETTLGQIFDYLEDMNCYTEMVLLEAVLSGSNDYLKEAIEIWLDHDAKGHMTADNYARRQNLWEKLKKTIDLTNN